MNPMSRRGLLAATAAGSLAGAATKASAQSFGNPDLPQQGAVSATNPQSIVDPGPQNPALASQFPSAVSPPATDVGGMPMAWSSFNNAPRRIQNGGWAREVTQADFAVSEEISGVNMRLTSGGIRELHWHTFAEWGYMTYGNCRVTVLDLQGRAYVSDVKEGDLWYFPAGYPHSLQGLSPGGCEFILCFDNGHASEFSTLLVTDWIAHTPPEILALNFGVPAETFSRIPLHNLWIFQGQLPESLEADRAAAQGAAGAPPYPYTFSMRSLPPIRQTKGGEERIADSSNFKVSTTIAAGLVLVHPRGLRELHWHPNADEWQYYLKGRAQVGVFAAHGHYGEEEFSRGQVAYIDRGFGHYIKQIGNEETQILIAFNSPDYQEISLSTWLAANPVQLLETNFGVDPAMIERMPDHRLAFIGASR
ncbi:MAG: cupin domain-containing protein [Alphaproteobacteria bacterium]|nr:cupin domain-containing protein [Alphaproteobacteria bacterium]